MTTATKPQGRIYRTHDKVTGDVTFCRANTSAQATNYVTRDRYNIRVATQDDLLGVPRESILSALDSAVHPDQQKLEGV